MTYPTYSHQHLQHKSIARLKQIYSEIACTLEVTDKRCKDSWITAIAQYQASKIQKLTTAAPNNQAIAQAELNHHIATQAQAIAPEELTTVEISFYDHEIYCGKELIASITHDDDLTQPWVVMVDGKEKFRANTWARCNRFIQWHLNNSQLPSRNSQLNSIPETRESVSRINKLSDHIDNCELRIANCELVLNEATPAAIETHSTTENRIMAHIFNECQKYGFEILDDGIYQNEVKLGQVGCTDGNWWVIRGSSGQQQYSNSVFDAVRSLSVIEELLDQPFDELTPQDWERLREYATFTEEPELVAA